MTPGQPGKAQPATAQPSPAPQAGAAGGQRAAGQRAAGQARIAAFTTLGVGGPAGRLAAADCDADLVAAVRAADERGEPLLVLGGGSNLVVADEGFPGAVVRVATRGVSAALKTGAGRAPAGQAGDRVAVTVAAGEEWDGVVAWSVAEGLSGLECLSGIPGLTGATPIQNVGAYGQEVAQTVTSVRVYDRRERAVAELSAAACGFGYRDSMFKRSLRPGAGTGRYLVLSVTFALERSPMSRPVAYAELARVLGLGDRGRAPLGQVRDAVLGLRRSKGMVLDPADPDTRSAGSFFTNPVLDEAALARLERAAARLGGDGVRVPRFPAGPGRVKVPAAWLIERAGFGRGYRPAGGRARISAKHTLALVNPGGATASDVLALAREICEGVSETFGVRLAAEPVLVGAAI